MKESDLPVGIELVETEDMHGVPCIELVIQCANNEIALNYYQSIQTNAEIVERVINARIVCRCLKCNTFGYPSEIDNICGNCKNTEKADLIYYKEFQRNGQSILKETK